MGATVGTARCGATVACGTTRDPAGVAVAAGRAVAGAGAVAVGAGATWAVWLWAASLTLSEPSSRNATTARVTTRLVRKVATFMARKVMACFMVGS